MAHFRTCNKIDKLYFVALLGKIKFLKTTMHIRLFDKSEVVLDQTQNGGWICNYTKYFKTNDVDELLEFLGDINGIMIFNHGTDIEKIVFGNF